MYGLGWGIAYGRDNSKTEAYLTLWQYQQEIRTYDWAPMSLRIDKSLAQVAEEPVKAQSEAIPDDRLWR